MGCSSFLRVETMIDNNDAVKDEWGGGRGKKGREGLSKWEHEGAQDTRVKSSQHMLIMASE